MANSLKAFPNSFSFFFPQKEWMQEKTKGYKSKGLWYSPILSQPQGGTIDATITSPNAKEHKHETDLCKLLQKPGYFVLFCFVFTGLRCIQNEKKKKKLKTHEERPSAYIFAKSKGTTKTITKTIQNWWAMQPLINRKRNLRRQLREGEEFAKCNVLLSFYI